MHKKYICEKSKKLREGIKKKKKIINSQLNGFNRVKKIYLFSIIVID